MKKKKLRKRKKELKDSVIALMQLFENCIISRVHDGQIVINFRPPTDEEIEELCDETY